MGVRVGVGQGRKLRLALALGWALVYQRGTLGLLLTQSGTSARLVARGRRRALALGPQWRGTPPRGDPADGCDALGLGGLRREGPRLWLIRWRGAPLADTLRPLASWSGELRQPLLLLLLGVGLRVGVGLESAVGPTASGDR